MKSFMFFALMCVLLFSCEKDESSVTGAVSETTEIIKYYIVLYDDWGTFRGKEPQDTLEYEWQGAFVFAYDSKDTVITTPYKELRFEYTAINDAHELVHVREELWFGDTIIDTVMIAPQTTQKILHIIPETKLKDRYISLFFDRMGEPGAPSIGGKFIVHSLLVVGVKEIVVYNKSCLE